MTGRKRALNILAIFLAVMALLTLLSRAAANIITPAVRVTAPGKGSLTYGIFASGTVEENMVQAVDVPPGIRVQQVLVKEGDKVKEGDTLLVLDPRDLEERILDQSREIEKLDLQIKDIEAKTKQEQEDRKREQERAQEDYDRAAKSWDAQVDQTYQAMTESRRRAQESADGGAPVVEEDSQLGESLQQSLEDACTQAENAYREALRQREENLAQAARKQEDAEKPSLPDSSKKSLQIDRQKLQEEWAKYLKLQEEKGVIKTEIGGVIRKIGVEAGSDTSEGSAVSIGVSSAGSRLTVSLPAEEGRYIEEGDEALVSSFYGNKEIKGLQVGSIRENPQDPQLTDVTVLLMDGQLEAGERARLEVEKKSKSYPCTLPVEALYMDNGQYFILNLQEVKTVMGTQLLAVRTDVRVLEKNGELAAIDENILTGSQQVIVASERSLKDGDRVRLEEE